MAAQPATPVLHTAHPSPRLLYRVQDAAEALSLSRSVVFKLLRSGRLRSVQEGRTRLIPYEALREYVAALEDVR